MAVHIGLLATELAVRVGSGQEPIILTKLTEVEGKVFVNLWKADPPLAKFLTGGRACKNLLAKINVFEKLAEARNAEVVKLMQDVEQPAALQDVDLADQLGVNEAIVPAASKPKKRRVMLKTLRMQLPYAIPVGITLADGEIWNPMVLVAEANRAVALEATADNLATLRMWVIRELEDGRDKEEVKKRASSQKAPRGPKGRREYFVTGKKNRWVKKELIEPRPGQRPYSKRRYRTLVRRSSDELSTTTANGTNGTSPATTPPRRRRTAAGPRRAERGRPPAVDD